MVVEVIEAARPPDAVPPMGEAAALQEAATAVMGMSLAGYAIATAVFVAITSFFTRATPRIDSAE